MLLKGTESLPILPSCPRSNALACVRGGLHLLGRKALWCSSKERFEVSASPFQGIPWVLSNALLEPDFKLWLEQHLGEFKI